MLGPIARHVTPSLRYRATSHIQLANSIAGPSRLARIITPLPSHSSLPTRSSSSIASFIASAAHRPLALSKSATSPSNAQIRGLKVRSSVKKMCEGCQIVLRKGVVRVICKVNPKHKQRQG